MVRGITRGCVAALALAVVAGASSLAAQPVGAQAPAMPELAGSWTGSDWGTVELRADGSGSYTDTYQGGAGRLTLRRVGERRYAGQWGESNQRFGTVELVLSPDRAILGGVWTPDPQSSFGTRTGGAVAWTRR